MASGIYPPHRTFNRVRLTYSYGTDSVPLDIQRACILMVAYDLMLSGISKSIPEGRDGFQPTAQEKIEAEINKILKKHRTLKIDGY